MNSVARGRFCRAFLIGLAMATSQAALLGAQTAPGNDASGDSIGPEQLRTFSIGGKPAGPVADQPVVPDLITPSQNRPPRPPPRSIAPPSSAPAATTTTSPAAAAPAPQPIAPVPHPLAPPAARALPQPASSVTVTLPVADPLARKPTPAGEADVPRLSSQPMGPNAPLQAAADTSDDSTLLPWIVALLMLGGAAIFYAFRTRPRSRPDLEPALAGAALTLPSEVPPRSFPPAPPLPPESLARTEGAVGGITVKRPDAFAPPPAAPPRPIGIISTRLRPQLEIEFEPTRATIDEAQASVQFDVVVTNSGSGAARQVLVEACMINAGPEQDAELRRFFDAPVGQGDRIDSIPPLGRISLKSAVSLPLDQVRAYEVGGRRLFVPLVAFNALYAWGSSEGQSSAAFILGRASKVSDGDGEPDAKMAPLRLDLGPRIFRGLEGRRHPLALRR